jgi:acetyl esterase/lipase
MMLLLGAAKNLHAANKPGAVRPVRVFKDIVYYGTPFDRDHYRHELDVYMPQGKGPWPVLFFLHGGGWVMGSKDDVLGLFGYATIARCLAERGLVVVIPNYRLSPGVHHPEHIKDVARAFAWTWSHAHKYRANPDEIFVCGHSAGGHLAALLATDDRYLRQVHRSPRDIRAVIGISGVYAVDDLDWKFAIAAPLGLGQVKMDVQPFSGVFGNDPKTAFDASPLHHVHRGLPPFLLLSAAWDYPPFDRMSAQFAKTLSNAGCPVETRTIPACTHETMLFDIPHLTIEAKSRDIILKFIDKHRSASPIKLPRGKAGVSKSVR